MLGVFVVGMLGIIVIALGMVMPDVLAFGVLCVVVIVLGMFVVGILRTFVVVVGVVVIALGVIMPGMVVSGVFRMIVITFGMVMSSVFIVGMFCMVMIILCVIMPCMVFFDMLLMISISVFIVPVFIMCCMALIGRRCGRRPEILDRIGCPQRAKQEQPAQGGTNLHCWSPALWSDAGCVRVPTSDNGRPISPSISVTARW
jgi:hypothetical protein